MVRCSAKTEKSTETLMVRIHPWRWNLVVISPRASQVTIILTPRMRQVISFSSGSAIMPEQMMISSVKLSVARQTGPRPRVSWMAVSRLLKDANCHPTA